MSQETSDKIKALVYCIENESHEDALGHLGDLFLEQLGHLNDNLCDQGDQRIFTPIGAFEYYVLGERR